jgi:hypothetical protein
MGAALESAVVHAVIDAVRETLGRRAIELVAAPDVTSP